MPSMAPASSDEIRISATDLNERRAAAVFLRRMVTTVAAHNAMNTAHSPKLIHDRLCFDASAERNASIVTPQGLFGSHTCALEFFSVIASFSGLTRGSSFLAYDATSAQKSSYGIDLLNRFASLPAFSCIAFGQTGLSTNVL